MPREIVDWRAVAAKYEDLRPFELYPEGFAPTDPSTPAAVTPPPAPVPVIRAAATPEGFPVERPPTASPGYEAGAALGIGLPDFKTPGVAKAYQTVDPELRSAVAGAPAPVTVTSARRTAAENKAAGGVPNSFHLTGQAVDIRTHDKNAKEKALITKHFRSQGYQVIDEGDHLHVEPGKRRGKGDVASSPPVGIPAPVSEDQPKPARSLMQRLAGLIIPSAEAAEADPLSIGGASGAAAAVPPTIPPPEGPLPPTAAEPELLQVGAGTGDRAGDPRSFLQRLVGNAKEEYLAEQRNLAEGGTTGPMGAPLSKEDVAAMATPQVPISPYLEKALDKTGIGKSKNPVAQATSGILRSLAKNVEGLTSGENLAYLSTGKLNPRMVAGLFAPVLAGGAYESGKEGISNLREGEYAKGSENLTTALISGLFALGATKHAAGPEGRALIAKGRDVLGGLTGEAKTTLANEYGAIGDIGKLRSPDVPGGKMLKDDAVPAGGLPATPPAPTVKPGPKKAVKLTSDEKVGLAQLRTEIEVAEAGRRIYQERAPGQGGDLEVSGQKSTFPIEGLGEKKTQLKIIDKALDGKKLTYNQQLVLEEMKQYAKQNYKPPEPIPTDTTRERGLITSLKESPNTPQEMRAELIGPETRYNRLKNKDVVAAAQEIVRRDPLGARDEILANRNPSAFDNAIGLDLIRHFREAGDTAEAVRVSLHLAESATRGGQATQILSILNRLGPDGIAKFAGQFLHRSREGLRTGQKEMLNKTAEAMAEAQGLPAPNMEIFNKAAQKLGLPSLSTELAAELQRRAAVIEGMPEGRPKALATAEMMKLVSDQVPAGVLKKVSGLQTMAQLLNPKTIIRNIVGNTGFTAGEVVSDVVGTGVDYLTGLVTGKRTKALPDLKAGAKGFVRGAVEGAEEVSRGVDLGPGRTQFDLQRPGTFKSKPLAATEKALNYALRVPDRAAWQAAYDMSISEQMRSAGKGRKGVKVSEPTEAMKEIATHDAFYRTFQDENLTTKFFTKGKKWLNLGQDFGIGDLVLKYPKTPANLLNRGVAYSPAGFVNFIYQASRPLLGKLTKGKIGGEFNQKAFVESFSRAAVGTTGLVGTGAMLHRLGIITGKPDSDKDIRGVQQASGLGAYRINVSALKRFALSAGDPDAAKLQKGDHLMSYDWFQPFAVSLSLGANMDESGGKPGLGTLAAITESTKEGVNTLAEQPLISGLARATKRGSLVEGAEQVLQDAPASFVPTLAKQANQYFDNTAREVRGQGFVDNAIRGFMAKVPGLAQSLNPKIDVFGKEQEVFKGGKNSFFNVFLNPAIVSEFNPSPEAQLVLDLAESTGETRHAPRVIGKTSKMRGIEIALTPDQREQMQRYAGGLTSATFQLLANDPEFNKLDDYEKVNVLSSKLTDIGKLTKVQVLGNEFLKESKKKGEVEGMLTQQEIERTQINAKAEAQLDRFKAAKSKEEKLGILKEVKKADPDLFEKLKDKIKDKKAGLTYEDRKIKSLGVENGYRANYILGVMRDMPTKEHRLSYLRELKQKGLLSADVIEQMKKAKKANKVETADSGEQAQDSI